MQAARCNAAVAALIDALVKVLLLKTLMVVVVVVAAAGAVAVTITADIAVNKAGDDRGPSLLRVAQKGEDDRRLLH